MMKLWNVGGPPFKLGITYKILLYFLAFFILAFVVIGSIAILGLDKMGDFAKGRSDYLAGRAATVSTATFEQLRIELISRKAQEVAKQINIYVASHPGITAEELRQDRRLAGITAQRIEQTGFTYMYEETRLYDPDCALQFLNTNRNLIDSEAFGEGQKRFTWSSLSLSNNTLSGYYYWENTDGTIRQWFICITPLDEPGFLTPLAGIDYVEQPGKTRLMVAATMSEEEFLAPSRIMKEDILASGTISWRYIQQQKDYFKRVSIITLLVLVIICGGLLFFLARSIITKPILMLADGARIIAKGDFNHRVSVRTGDEIEELAEQFNIMAGNLRNSYDSLEQKVRERTKAERRRSQQLRAINELGRRITSVLEIDRLLPYVVDSLKKTLKLCHVNIYLFEPDSGNFLLKAGTDSNGKGMPIGTPLKTDRKYLDNMINQGRPLIVNDTSSTTGIQGSDESPDGLSRVYVPVKARNKFRALLEIKDNRSGEFDEIDLSTMQTLGDQIAVAIDNANLCKLNQEMAIVQERNRMAREIHDTLAQGFVGILLHLRAAERAIDADPEKARNYLNEAKTLARENLEEARRSVKELRPQTLEHLTLAEKLQQETARISKSAGLNIILTISGNERDINCDAKHALMKICQEALANVERHSQASQVDIRLSFGRNKTTLSVRDNGIGFNPESVAGHCYGIMGMRERALLAGGRFSLQSKEGQGTLVVVAVFTDRR